MLPRLAESTAARTQAGVGVIVVGDGRRAIFHGPMGALTALATIRASAMEE